MRSKKECLRIANLAEQEYKGFGLDGKSLQEWLTNKNLRSKFLDMYDPKIKFTFRLNEKLILCCMNIKTYNIKTYEV